jgi:hypothetical protein
MTTKSTPDLSILYSCRIRLTEDERQTLKQAYKLAKEREITEGAPVMPGTSIRVVSASLTGDSVDQQLGMSQVLVMDLLNSRDSIHVPLLIKIQRVLGVEIVTKKRLMDTSKSYIDFILTKES